jgi:hypothetical protein
MGKPGWPLLDLLTASTASMRMLFTQSVSREAVAAAMDEERGDEGEMR